MTIETFKRNWEPDLDRYARFNFNLDLKELIEQIREDAIEECIKEIENSKNLFDNSARWTMGEKDKLQNALKKLKNSNCEVRE